MSEPRNTELYSEFAGNPGLKNRPGPAVGLVRACERIEGLEAELSFLRGKTPGDLVLSAIGSSMLAKSAEDLADVLMKDNERLREALKKIADSAGSAPFWDLRSIALAALPPPEQEGK